jgi:hypothetical protein
LEEDLDMRKNLFWLSQEQWNRIEPRLPTDVGGVERADDAREADGLAGADEGGQFPEPVIHTLGV